MNASPRFCQQCGAQLSPAARFCNTCGAPVKPAQPPQDSPIPPTFKAPEPQTFSSEPPHTPPVYSPEPAKPPRPAWLIPTLAVIAVCLVVICIGIGLVWNYYSKSEEEATATSTHTEIAATLTETPTLQPTEPIIPTTPSLPQASFGNASFSYDQAIAREVIGETVPASVSPDAPYWDLYPAHTRFTFIDYPLYPEAFHTPELLIYPASEFAALNPGAADTINRFGIFITQRPPQPPEDGIPFLPVWNAAQMMRAVMVYLDFQNGNGVRFLSQYGQAAYPISSQHMFYTFQGMTQDRRYYISAIFPVSNPILPDPNSVELNEAFYSNFPSYVKDIETLLGAQPPSSFTPNLDLLDALIRSLLVQ